MGNHQYVGQHHNAAVSEALLADHVIRFLYNRDRESPGAMLSALASARLTDFLAHWQFDRTLTNPKRTLESVAQRLGIVQDETTHGFAAMRTLRDMFERQIRYWDCRPLPQALTRIVSPADGKVLPFQAFRTDSLPIKEKFIRVASLLGDTNLDLILGRREGLRQRETTVARLAPLAGVITRLTPDVYHYTHAPVSGRVLFTGRIEGAFHSCNPAALVRFPGSYAVNRRAITLYDSDVPGGTGVGVVAQIDVAAMMIGQIEPRFSVRHYEQPRPLIVGDFIPRGSPVSMFRPGSSTSIVLWNGERASMTPELIENAQRRDLSSRFSDWLGQPWVETQIHVRQAIASASAGS